MVQLSASGNDRGEEGHAIVIKGRSPLPHRAVDGVENMKGIVMREL
jgi:hypothetical protein